MKKIFVGYSDSSSGYEFYDLKVGDFFTSGSAIFDESCFPAFMMKDELENLLINELDYRNDSEYEMDENDQDDDEYDNDQRRGKPISRRVQIMHYDDENDYDNEQMENLDNDVLEN
jgi:muramoyltetrapeptide carboxypeptidase LdcA involved in peptidoglycan recycling